MSAYFVEKQTIDLLVSAAIELELNARLPGGEWAKVTSDNADLFGAQLWLENARSLVARYPGDADEHESNINTVQSYRFQRWAQVKLAAAISCARNLDYQSCEHAEWRQTRACEFLNRIFQAAAVKLAGEWPWGVRDDAEASKWATKVQPMPARAIRKRAPRRAPAPTSTPAKLPGSLIYGATGSVIGMDSWILAKLANDNL